MYNTRTITRTTDDQFDIWIIAIKNEAGHQVGRFTVVITMAATVVISNNGRVTELGHTGESMRPFMQLVMNHVRNNA